MTPFKELAERIGAHPELTWFCCNQLEYYDARAFFKKFFVPTQEEADEYKAWYDKKELDGGAWMSTKNRTEILDNTDRITALLFADQLWQDEENRKYDRI